MAYGGRMGVEAFKGTGLVGGVRMDGHMLPGPWRYWPLPLDVAMLDAWAKRTPPRPPLPDPQRGSHQPLRGAAPPQLFVGSWKARTAADCFVNLKGWGKGTVAVNGHALGRYWSVGPQKVLYLPAPWVRVGRNSLLIFELQPSAALMRNASVLLTANRSAGPQLY